jgi:hypothetical protein
MLSPAKLLLSIKHLSKALSLRGLVLMLMPLTLAATAALAQPDPPDSSQTAKQATAKLAEIEAKEKTLAPKELLAAYEGFLKEYPHAPKPAVVRAITKAGALKFDKLGDREGALATVHTALDKLDLEEFPTQRIMLARTEAKYLLAAKKPAEAEAVLRKYWDLIANGHVRSGDAALAYKQLFNVLEAAGKPGDAVALLQNICYEKPELLNDDAAGSNAWIWDKIIAFHLANAAADKTDVKASGHPALRWAKLRFMLCDFDEAALARATGSLSMVWVIVDPAQIKAFVAAQEDPKQPNPLAKVALPFIDAGLVQPLLQKGLVETRISLLLCLNTPASQRAAMLEAFKLLNNPASAARGAAQACRIFKAGDLSTRRANEFLGYAKDAQGGAQRAKLVSDFLAERADKTEPAQ